MLVIGWCNHLKQRQEETLCEPCARTAEFVKYSDWQLNRLRDALHAFKYYGRSFDGDYFNWKDVREAIALETDVEIGADSKKGAERLRQFVEGIKDKDRPGRKKYPVLQDEWITAVAQFATGEDNGLLSREELDEHAPGYQAPMRLLEYLDESADAERRIPVEKLQGNFTANQTTDDNYIWVDLTLQRPSEHGLVQVSQMEVYYDPDDIHVMAEGKHFLTLRSKGEGPKHKSFVVFHGWAILTPEDNLFFFLKNERNGTNRYYFSLGVDLVPWNDAPVTKLVLLRHDFPLTEDNPGKGPEQKGDPFVVHAAENILTFDRKRT